MRLESRPPSASFFKGDDRDGSKLKALREVAEMIKAFGSLRYDEAATTLCAARGSFFTSLNGQLAPERRVKASGWTPQVAGIEMLARLPLVRVPLESFGPSGGRQQSLVLPIIPGMSDAELLEHVSFVKHVSFVTVVDAADLY